MNERNIVVALDVGTTKVCTIIGSKNANSELEIIGIGGHPSEGLKKGSVVNIGKTINSIRHSLSEAKLMAGVEISKVTVGIAGSHIYSFNSSGVVAIKGKEITQADITRVLEAAKAVVLPSDREILHVIPQEYRVDDVSGIKNPLGMYGVRLEANVHIVTGAVSRIHNLVKCVEQTGVKTEKVILQPIASSEAVLTEEEKELGVALIDIGGGTTDIAIWNEGSLVHTQVIPVGGNHFTNDLAVALKIPHGEAERIKINYGSVLAETLNQSAHITVKGLSGTRARQIQLGTVARVLGARAEELFKIIKDIIHEKAPGNRMPGGHVLTGGGALIQSMPQLGEYMMERPTKIGLPISFGGMTNLMKDPKYSTVMGLLLEADKRCGIVVRDKDSVDDQMDLVKKLGDSLRSVFREIF